MADFANRRRMPATAFKVGNIVMLDTRNIRIIRLIKSLDYKNMGPFKVIRVINNIVYELKLPEGMNVHPVFHSWLLYINNNNPLSG